MPKSLLEVPEIGTVYVTKKRGQRTMRLRVDPKGAVQITLPWLVSRNMVMQFVLSKRDWIKKQQAEYVFRPYDGMMLGKTLVLRIEENSVASRTKLKGKTIIVPFPALYEPQNGTHVEKIKKAVMKALRNEAETVLLPRLREFAYEYGFEFHSAGIKQVTGRWGSCDSNKHISLSLYLIQLPIELIDYVLIHELAHTRHMNHSPAFWSSVESVCPDFKHSRKQIRSLRPRIYDAKTFMA